MGTICGRRGLIALRQSEVVLPIRVRARQPRLEQAEPVLAVRVFQNDARVVRWCQAECQVWLARLAVASSAAVAAIRAVERAGAQAACDKLAAGQLAVALLTPEVAPALRAISEPVPDRIRVRRAELVWVALAKILAVDLGHLCLAFAAFAPGVGATQPRQGAKEKADFRDGLRAWVDCSLNRYSVEALKLPSVVKRIVILIP